MRTTVRPEATDLAPNIAKMVTGSPHFPQLRVIVLDELISKSGSYVDIEALSRKTRLPVVAVLRRKIIAKRLPKKGARISQRALKVFAKLTYRMWKAGGKILFVYSAGLGKIDLDEILGVCASKEGLPEAARVARIIASSLEKFLVGRRP